MTMRRLTRPELEILDLLIRECEGTISSVRPVVPEAAGQLRSTRDFLRGVRDAGYVIDDVETAEPAVPIEEGDQVQVTYYGKVLRELQGGRFRVGEPGNMGSYLYIDPADPNARVVIISKKDTGS